jgi:hypothetical protein
MDLAIELVLYPWYYTTLIAHSVAVGFLDTLTDS